MRGSRHSDTLRAEVKASFIEGGLSLKTLSERFEVPVKTLERWRAREKWILIREGRKLVYGGAGTKMSFRRRLAAHTLYESYCFRRELAESEDFFCVNPP